MDVRRIGNLKRNDVIFGNRISVKVVKNKVAPPFKRVELDLLFNEGISRELDLLDAALHYGVLKKSGAWISLDGKNIAQGRDQMLKFLKGNPDITNSIEKRVHEAIALSKQANLADDDV